MIEQGYIKETITFYRPANAGRKYLNTKDWSFEGKPNGDYYIVNEMVEEKTIPLPLKTMENIRNKCYVCGQQYFCGNIHNCPTNWNTGNCEKIENEIQNIRKKIEEYEAQRAEEADHEGQMEFEQAVKEMKEEIVEKIKRIKAPIELMQDGQSLDYSFRKGFNQALQDFIDFLKK